MKKILFFVIWVGLLTLGPITIYLNTPIANLTMSPSAIANSLQRILGLTAFTLLFAQLLLGVSMDKAKKYFGDWVYNFHIIQGILIYFLVILHGLSFVYFNYVIFQRFDPFYIFVDVCVLCASQLDHYYNFGRVGFWFLTIAIFAGLFRGFNLWMRQNWRRFHYLNYLAFLFLGLHAYFVGTDTLTTPYKYFYFLSMSLVILITIKKLINLIFPKIA